MKKLSREFYRRDSIEVAKDMLGKILVHELDGQRIAMKITETEAYMGIGDKASHAYGGRRTKRVEVMYGNPGFSYVYMIYGMYYCFNITTNEKEIPHAVLIRAGEPTEGIELMSYNRFGKPYDKLEKKQIEGLTNGPGKLCQSLSIDKKLNGIDICSDILYLEDNKNESFNIVKTKRVGIDYAEEAKDFPWRFYIEGNKYISVK